MSDQVTSASRTSGSGNSFGDIHMRGGRYESPGLPLSGTEELRRYQDLLVRVAKSLFLREHPRRKRVPRGFESGAELRLTEVREGSVIPVLERPAPGTKHQELLTDVPDYLERSRRLVNDALRGVADRQPSVPTAFPAELVRDLAHLGRSLREEEWIEFSSATDPRPAVVSTENRKRLQALANLGEIEVERVLVGQITGLRASPQQFDLALQDGSRITGSYQDEDRFEDLHEFLDRGDRAPMAALSVIATSSLNGTLRSVTDVLGIEAALPTEWADRISVLSGLRQGWLHPDSPTVDESALASVEQFLLACVDEGISRPRIYPTPSGGVLLEWSHDESDTELEFSNGRANVRWVSLVTDDERESSVGWFDVDGLIEALEELSDLG